ncbi:translation initiation factor IF-2-like [Moschus berezovskii]|uniref:translation initiation factor IF-2-like n=1 Tax=Moschus berezovskii TaxID=68408 RepID=UPI002444AC8E|nr:translation initiation factor IF-2-like [Moschus berezovskii]XP_055288903.1 translation initiation factor IF-2-like [Moschus berezovskii]XP_055288904.1 translation initiation factor IF-2-like [Moschus berezovskii]XP_055288905.1 translation initiation factor IF-2-like [Moschus berezovskii]XP_055288906.1 translation initiation factor IF-2-like [Moschus berezovskii]XP_055288907.1 translation initiation factor IF-2-like [Moschus berezovskii]
MAGDAQGRRGLRGGRERAAGRGGCREGDGGDGLLSAGTQDRAGGAAARTCGKQEAAVGEARSPSPAGGPSGGGGSKRERAAPCALQAGRTAPSAGAPAAPAPPPGPTPGPPSRGSPPRQRGRGARHAPQRDRAGRGHAPHAGRGPRAPHTCDHACWGHHASWPLPRSPKSPCWPPRHRSARRTSLKPNESRGLLTRLSHQLKIPVLGLGRGGEERPGLPSLESGGS